MLKISIHSRGLKNKKTLNLCHLMWEMWWNHSPIHVIWSPRTVAPSFSHTVVFLGIEAKNTSSLPRHGSLHTRRTLACMLIRAKCCLLACRQSKHSVLCLSQYTCAPSRRRKWTLCSEAACGERETKNERWAREGKMTDFFVEQTLRFVSRWNPS